MKEFPQKLKDDNYHALAKGIISTIPTLGSPLSILFETVFSAPLDKRKEKWFQSLAETIEKLINKVENLTPEILSQNEIFISVSMQATQIALRNHQKEKLDALKNAIKNSINIKFIDENKILIFTRIIDDMTPLHLKILNFLSNPNKIKQDLQSKESKNTQIFYSNNMTIWENYYPEMSSSKILISQVCKELYAKGFLSQEIQSLGVGKMTSNFGDDFLHFISNS